MAIIPDNNQNTTASRDPAKRFARRYRVPAGAASIIFCSLAVAGLIVRMLLAGLASVSAGAMTLQLTWVAIFAGMATLGSLVIAGRRQAFWITLTFWLAIAGCGVVWAFDWLIRGALPAWLGEPWWVWAIAALGLVLAGGVVVTLEVLATAEKSRNRYGAMVGVSVALSIVLVLVANMLAQSWPSRRNFETLGRFGLSQRTRRVLEKVDQPIRLSAIYAAAKSQANTEPARKKQAQTQHYLRRVTELFEEMSQANPKIITADASGDQARAQLLARLRHKLLAPTRGQETLVKKIQSAWPGLRKQLDAARAKWTKIPARPYLELWNTGQSARDTIDQATAKLESAYRKVAQVQESDPLPDYPKLLDELIAQLQAVRKSLDARNEMITRLAELPGKVHANAPKLTAAMERSSQAIATVQKILDQPAKPATATKPAGPTDTLKKLGKAFSLASRDVRVAAELLENIAGKDKGDAQLISRCQAWSVAVPSRFGQVRTTRSKLLFAFAQQLESLRSQTDLQISDANAEAQNRFLQEMRKVSVQLGRVMKNNRRAVDKGMGQLRTVDKFSKPLLTQAKTKGGLFGDILNLTSPLVSLAAKLTPPGKSLLPKGLSDENIIVIEAGPKVQVVAFSEVWPGEMKADFFLPEGTEPRRYFNGDALLGSRILSLVREKPFAKVLITYYKPAPAPGRPSLVEPIPPGQLNVLRQRLRAANFQVDDWNLTGPLPSDEPGDLPVVLLVLPPAGPGLVDTQAKGRFGPGQVSKVSQAIDAGASAVFLTKALMPHRSLLGRLAPSYPYDEYLRKNWGIDVHVGAMLIQGLPSDQPDKYLLDISKLAYLPLNDFTANPIGKPLRGRRLAWLGVCPMTVAKPVPAGVNIQPILTVPATMTNIWASADLEALAAEVHLAGGNLISPHYDKGDMKVPLTLALAATRPGDKTRNVAPARLVVMGVGGGLVDWYLTSPVRSLEAGYRTTAPPRANAELVVNSVYWLIGRERLIAAGPMRIKPVEQMSPITQTILWAGCVIALPTTLLLIGAAVGLMRRK